MNLLRALSRTWFTGLIYCFAVLGYIVYFFLLFLRMLRLKLLSVFIILLLLVAVAGGVYFFVPLKDPGKEITFIVEKGTTVQTVAEILKKKMVIPNVKLFLLWVKLKDLERSMQAGEYTFYEYEGIFSAAQKLRKARAIEKSVTIPEGLTIEQTASAVIKVFPVDSTRFVRLCHDTALRREFKITGPSLEGYLFPDTYRFLPSVEVEEIVTTLVRHFFKEYNSIPQTPLSKTFTCHEIITLASIVEKEATVPAERTHIAGVFHNRLRKNWPLGADPTVRYFLRKFSGPLRVSELQNPSPYNTRIHTGLPPGPICSPGKGAITAAIAPLDTKDLYFVAKWDGSGEHDFSETNAEHERKKRVIRRRNRIEKWKKKNKES